MTNPASPRPPKRPKSSGEPTLIRCGSVAVKIYKLSREKGAYFTVSWHTGPKRNRQNFKAFEAAKKFARDRAEELAAGQVNSPTVTIAQAQDMKEALRRIGPLGTPVHVVAGEYADVVNQLGGTGTLRQAVEFFLHNSIRPEMQRTVAQVMEEFVSSKKANGCSRPYIEDCTWRLRRFAADFQMSIAHICTRDIEDWLCKRSTSLVTRNDFRRLIITLFNFARRRGYPLLGMWTDQGQQCMVIGFGGHPELSGDNTFSRTWVPVNSDFIGEIGYFGTQGDFILLSKSSSNPSNAVSWSFNFTGRSTVAGDTMAGQFSSRSIAFDNVEPGSKNPGVSYWSGTTAVIWNADIGTNKRELRMKFFGSPSSGYGNRDPLATRVIASTEWTASRWRGTGTSDPTTPQDGDLFFRSDTAKVRIYASGSWRDLN